MQNRKRRKATGRGAFTLLEVLLVLAILGVIAALVVPNLLGSQLEANKKASRVSVEGFEKAVKLYAINNNGDYPEGDSETVIQMLLYPPVDEKGQQPQPYLERYPKDAWERPLMYEYPPTGNRQTLAGKPAIWSMGPDGQDGTEDDISNWGDEEDL